MTTKVRKRACILGRAPVTHRHASGSVLNFIDLLRELLLSHKRGHAFIARAVVVPLAVRFDIQLIVRACPDAIGTLARC